MPKVWLVVNDWLIERMYITRGWEIVSSPDKADLIQFTGGEDVDPSLYGEEKHASTHSNPGRDSHESHIFRGNRTIPMAGICRGGQFLNVMCGGSMWQDCDNHAISTVHPAYSIPTQTTYEVTSTHHQMMKPSDEAMLLLHANLSTFRATATQIEYKERNRPFKDVEGLYYPSYNVLCFQPHPEYVGDHHECQQLYFDYLKRYLGL